MSNEKKEGKPEKGKEKKEKKKKEEEPTPVERIGDNPGGGPGTPPNP